MEKRYQVFVSSTFTDLEDERSKAFSCIMGLDFFPAGMEIFPAADEEQFEYIKKVIADSDYYVLIIGARYGSVSDDGISYTEKEFDYAVSSGVPIIALIHDRPEEIPTGKSETKEIPAAKLQAFKDKVKSGRLVKFWHTPDQLVANLQQALIHAKKVYPRIGWVRANEVASNEILAEINDLRKENDQLKEKIRVYENNNSPAIPNIAGLDERTTLTLTISPPGKPRHSIRVSFISLRYIFGGIAPYIMLPMSDEKVLSKINEYVSKRLSSNLRPAQISESNFQTIKIQFVALGLVSLIPGRDMLGNRELHWEITDAGKSEMFRIRTIKASANSSNADQNEDLVGSISENESA